MVSLFEIYVKVYIKAAVLNNDGIFHEKPLPRSSTENFSNLQFFSKKTLQSRRFIGNITICQCFW